MDESIYSQTKSAYGGGEIIWDIHAAEQPVNYSLYGVCSTYTCVLFAI